MLPHLQSTYTTLDQTLTRLTDSIAAYNPSPHLASDLLNADTQITSSLQTLLTHQTNHARIQSLQRTLAHNDTQLKDLFRRILALRIELVEVKAYEREGEGGRKAVGVEELLKYAKFISKTTVPPTFRGRLGQRRAGGGGGGGGEGKGETETGVNGVGQSAGSPSQQQDVLGGGGDTEGQDANIGVKTMNAEEKEWLDPLAGAQFVPWPSFDLIQRGALGDIQRLVDRGVDPADVLSPEEQAEVDRKRREEEEREKAEQEERERRRMSMFDVGRRTNTLAQDDVFDPDA